MKILLKNALKSAGKNKVQTAVILLTIVVVTAMLFIALSMSDIFYLINMAEYDRVAQGADILLTGETFSKTRVDHILARDADEVEYVEYFLNLQTVLKTDEVSKLVQAEVTDLAAYLARHEVKIVQKYESERPQLGGPTVEFYPIIVGESFAKQANIQAGDTIELYLATMDAYTKLTVLYVAANEGIFGALSGINILLDFDAVGNYGQVNAAYIHLKDETQYDKYKERFEELMPNTTVSEGNQKTLVKQLVKSNTTLLAVGLGFLIATMMLILLTAYLIIARNRVGEMVIFKSAGATPMQVVGIMLLEVVLYALGGALFGVLVGRFAMEFILLRLLPMARAVMVYPVWKYIAAIALAVLVTILACLAPIVSTSKKTVREMMAASEKKVQAKRPVLFGVMSACMVGLAVAVRFLRGAGALAAAGCLVLSIALWVYLSVPFVQSAVCFLLSKTKKSGSFLLATKTLRQNRAMRTITVLVGVIVAFSFVVVEVLGVVKTAITPYATRFDADYAVVTFEKLDKLQHEDVVAQLKQVAGVNQVGYFNSTSFFLPGQTKNPMTFYGVRDGDTLVQAASGGLTKGTTERFAASQNPIVLSRDMMERYQYAVGDFISFTHTSKDFANVSFNFEIVGIDETVTEYDLVAYVRYDALSLVTQTATYLVSGEANRNQDGVDETFLTLRTATENLAIGDKKIGKTYALTYNEFAFAGQASLSGVMQLLTLLQVLLYLISAVGVLNISLVTLFDRRYELLLYHLSGMTPSDYRKFSFGEGLGVGLAGGVVGFVASFAFYQAVPTVASLVNKFLRYPVFPVFGLVTALICATLFVGLWFGISLLKRHRLPNINERLN